jgi:hypothetical protein
MVNAKRTEIILIGVVGALLGAAMMPTDALKPMDAGTTEAGGPKHRIRSSEEQKSLFDRVDETVEALERRSRDIAAAAGMAESPQDVPVELTRVARPSGELDQLFPLVPGMAWTYRVTGPDKVVPSANWVQRVVSEPEGDSPGIVEVGFEGKRTIARLYENRGALLFDGLPFTEPLEIGGAAPAAMRGELFPQAVRVLEGAVWSMISTRQILHKHRDKEGNVKQQTAVARQKDRAQVKRFETVVVPAGRFGAHRIDWLSRVDIKADGRPVLEELTTEPYRRERMWVAPGFGIVKRVINYLRGGRIRETIIFELTLVSGGDDCVIQDVEIQD